MTEASTGSRLAGLVCRACCAEVEADRPQGTCPTCGGALFAEYDLRGFDGRAWLRGLAGRPTSLWRYRELLPARTDDHVISLGEGFSPILPLGETEGAPGVRLSAKDDGGLPTGSFKARGMAVAVSRAVELGLTALFVPSAGNAALALAAYGARAQRSVRVYVPDGTMPSMIASCRAYGADVRTLPGTLREVGAAARAAEQGGGAFDMSTLREPYRVEGKKTMGLEIFEQSFADGLPDAIVYPTGGGTGLVGMQRAFDALRTLGLLERGPRLYAVQPEGCAPVVRALREGATTVAPWGDPRTIAPGLLVPAPFAGERILEAVRASRGDGATVSDPAIVDAMRTLARRHGISASPEAAATYAAVPELVRAGRVRSGETVLLYLTGTGIPFSIEALAASVAGGTAPAR
ncbi:MAG TPA: threonine synthase [Thermoplasmata archaeon]|nr:threonine synthase [Thermoplasmata archaeon]